MIHHLKIYPEHFSAVCTGIKRAELRKNDRDFKVGDTLHLMETPKVSCNPTGEFINAVVTHIADVGEWLPGYVMLSIERESGYAAPQLPQPSVVPSNELLSAIEEVLRISDRDHEAWHRARKVIADFRAVMLQGAEPVSQREELPMDYLQGHKDGLEWAARLAEANHPQTGDWLYDDPLELAKAIRKGPDMPTAPVQGWIPCSERMPEEIGRYWCYVEEQNSLGKSHYQWNCSWNGDRWWVESENGGRVTHWMPLQEPPKQTAES
ncbi:MULTISPECIES: DUF3850 domain-containing protein [unclassified Leclercia]|uniref:DUF3850 domain-containing protein n=1 Tax=unclassified Leclercia TaxID=2627398 RepID=UPI0025C34686|nr:MULTISPECIES: DUF3850 domain-containing protein [unclassified Leclercia]